MIEANPRASRTVPFVSKAIGIPLAKLACRIMLGERIADLDLPEEPMAADHVSVKEAVLPFDRFDGADAILGPEMRSTGEVMGVARDFPTAFAKAQAAAGVAAAQRRHGLHHRHRPRQAGRGRGRADAARPRLQHRRDARARSPRSSGWASRPALLKKVGEGSPNVVDWIESGEVDLVVNTPTGSGARTDGWEIRRAAVARGVPCLTTLSGGAGGGAGDRLRRATGQAEVLSLQEIHRPSRAAAGDGVRLPRPGSASASRRRSGGACVHVVERREHGAYVVLAAADPDGPVPLPGQFYMLAAAERWGGGDDERPLLPRAFSVLRRRRLAAGARVHARGRRARDAAAVRAAARATGCGCSGRSGLGFTRARRRAPRLLCGGGVGTAPLAILQDVLLADGVPAPALLGFRDAAHAAGRRAADATRVVATDDGSVGHHGLVTELLADELDAGRARRVYACGPPPMLEAVRALCEARGVPAQLALESGMACGFGACFGCVVPVRGGGYVRAVRRRPGARGGAAGHLPDGGPGARMSAPIELLRARARAPDRQRLGHVRRDRRAARLRRRDSRRGVPVRRVRLEDDHARAARRQPAAAALRDGRRA